MQKHVIGWMLLCLAVAAPCQAQSVPVSPRSRETVARVKPRLQAELMKKKIGWGAPLFIRIFKQEKVLEVWLRQGRHFRLFKSYPVCTYGGRGIGPKSVQGDGRAPEGFYYVTPRQMNPYSHYHLAFNLGYPNAFDRAKGRTGGALMVHGRCVSIGCFAMGDTAIEEIYTLAEAALKNGQPFFRVHIFPFEMTRKKLKQYEGRSWHGFWQNLKKGHDLFVADAVPPNVVVRQGRYVFESKAPSRAP
jgi:murein L,D-transpeptidase YafK